MTAADSYKTIKGSGKGIYREKGSKFLGFAFGVTSSGEAMDIVAGLKKEYHDARHHCFAYMTGADRTQYRVNDDGEPSGTAGRPILGQINSAGLTDVLIVVVRYFGGTLLGVSGLVNAYRSAAAAAISDSKVVTRTVMKEMEIRFPWVAMNDVMKILKENAGVKQTDHTFGNECMIRVSIPAARESALRDRFLHITGVSLS